MGLNSDQIAYSEIQLGGQIIQSFDSVSSDLGLNNQLGGIFGREASFYHYLRMGISLDPGLERFDEKSLIHSAKGIGYWILLKQYDTTTVEHF